MNNRDSKRYSTAFTAGALLLRETDIAVASLRDFKDFMNGDEVLDVMVLPVNSESSRKRIAGEIVKRMKALPDFSFIDLFTKLDSRNKKLILFYAVCKHYTAILDFMIEVVVKKWNNIDLELKIEDYQNFLFIKMDFHPELLKITDKTKYKAAQVTLKMLKELGVLVDGKLSKQEFDINVLKAISLAGDNWFLDIVFLNNMEKEKIFEA